MYGDIVILSGAGISAESGIPTFRDSDGLWNNHRIEDVATIEAYERHPEQVHDFYNGLKIDLQKGAAQSGASGNYRIAERLSERHCQRGDAKRRFVA